MFFAGKNESLKRGLKKVVKCFLFVVALFFAAAFLFAFAKLMQKGFSLKICQEAWAVLQKILAEPWLLFKMYMRWGEVFYSHWGQNNLTAALFVPALFPIGIAFFAVYNLVAWGRKKAQKMALFKNPEQLLNSDFFDGNTLVIGKKDDKFLRLKSGVSALVLGDCSSGKTKSVVIPTILQADDCCIIAASTDNDFAKYTSGYRAKLGKVYYFNWLLKDEPLKNEFFARWNPLSPLRGQKDVAEKEKYLASLAKYFVAFGNDVSYAQDAYWEKLATRALTGLLCFFYQKVNRAVANDYFLSCLLEKNFLSPEDKNLLLSYYVLMDKEYAAPAVAHLEKETINMENYLPIGSWEGIPKEWQGKELCFAMFSDWLLRAYLVIKTQDENNDDVWKTVLEYCAQEAQFFGYETDAAEILQQVFYLSIKQRNVIFPMILNPLSVFKNPSVRERTSTSDFDVAKIWQTDETGKNPIVTIYCVAENKNVGFINKLFIDFLLEAANRSCGDNVAKIFIFDDAEKQPKYEFLNRGLAEAKKHNVSFLMTTNDVETMAQKYENGALSDMINHMEVKVVLAENAPKASAELGHLAEANTFALKSETTEKKKINGALYFRKLAKDLTKVRKNILNRDDVILFIPNYYQIPLKMRSSFFLESEVLKIKALQEPNYFISADLLKLRNSQDNEIPDLVSVLQNEGFKISSEEDIEIFMENKYEEAVETMEKVGDKESVLVDDISSRWKTDDENEDWWMTEKAFDVKEREENLNPFAQNKK